MSSRARANCRRSAASTARARESIYLIYKRSMSARENPLEVHEALRGLADMLFAAAAAAARRFCARKRVESSLSLFLVLCAGHFSLSESIYCAHCTNAMCRIPWQNGFSLYCQVFQTVYKYIYALWICVYISACCSRLLMLLLLHCDVDNIICNRQDVVVDEILLQRVGATDISIICARWKCIYCCPSMRYWFM